MKKKKFNGKIVICFLSILVIYILGYILMQCLDETFMVENYHTVDVDKYRSFEKSEEEKEGIHSGLMIFPEQLYPEMEDVSYFYLYDTNMWDNIYEIYLKAKYSDEDFELEKGRLKNISSRVNVNGNEKEQDIQYTEDLFVLPAYVAIYASNNSFEYALVDEETKTIIYIYLQNSTNDDLFRKEYLPYEYQKKELLEDNSWNNTNIYYVTDQNGDHVFYRD